MSIILLCILIVCCCVIAWPYQLVAGKMHPSVDFAISVHASMVCQSPLNYVAIKLNTI